MTKHIESLYNIKMSKAIAKSHLISKFLFFKGNILKMEKSIDFMLFL